MRTKNERIDTCLSHFSRKVSEYYEGHEQRLKDHVIRIHEDAGPVKKCKCKECNDYRITGSCGEYHEIACGCRVCKENSYFNNMENQRKLVARTV